MSQIYTDLKRAIPLNHVVKIEPTPIKIGVLQFHDGSVKDYDFIVEYISKFPYSSNCRGEHDYKDQWCFAYGTITYKSGASYLKCEKLTYTDDEYIKSLIEQVKKSLPEKWDDVYNLYNIGLYCK